MSARLVAMSGRAESLSLDPGEVVLDFADLPPLLPEGTYSAVLVWHETAYAFGGPKVYLHFRITEMGDFFNKVLYRAYRVQSISGKGSRGGQFRIRRGQDIFEMLYRVLTLKVRPDRVSLHALKGKLLKVKVRTVKKNSRQKPLPEALWYSVVDDVICVEAG